MRQDGRSALGFGRRRRAALGGWVAPGPRRGRSDGAMLRRRRTGPGAEEVGDALASRAGRSAGARMNCNHTLGMGSRWRCGFRCGRRFDLGGCGTRSSRSAGDQGQSERSRMRVRADASLPVMGRASAPQIPVFSAGSWGDSRAGSVLPRCRRQTLDRASARRP